MMAHTLYVLLLVAATMSLCWAQAPGDEETRCTVQHSSPPTYPDTERNLMDSYNYEDLVPGNGTGSIIATAVWNDYSFDGNDVDGIVAPTYWQELAGGLCRFQARVCGWRQNGVIVPQDNWLFTQHIRQDFDSSTYNYDVTIRVFTNFGVPNCRERKGCRPRFNLLRYFTDTPRSASIEGTGYMNPSNYEQFAEPYGPDTLISYKITYTFTLPPTSTGFYIAAQDTGSCLTLSRLRVYRNNCKYREVGLVRYPDAPAPVSGTANVKFSCVENGGPIGTDTVGCTSEGTWADDTPPRCGCLPGYQVNTETSTCEICPQSTYQPLVSATNKCKDCPVRSFALESGTAECECEAGYLRHPDKPDDPCIRSPSPPLFDLTKPPELEGTKVTAIWLPPVNSGGDPDNLYFDVYAAQLVRGESPTFCRQNKEPIDDSCNEDGSECRHEITTLNSNTPYAILVVAGNSATDDPECISNITLLGSRYLVMVVGTENQIDTSGLSTGAAVGVTFIVTLLVSAIATASIIIIVLFVCLKRGSCSKQYTTNGQNATTGNHSALTMTTTSTKVATFNDDTYSGRATTNNDDERKSPSFPPPYSGPAVPPTKPGRPQAAPPKPPAPPRPPKTYH